MYYFAIHQSFRTFCTFHLGYLRQSSTESISNPYLLVHHDELQQEECRMKIHEIRTDGINKINVNKTALVINRNVSDSNVQLNEVNNVI